MPSSVSVLLYSSNTRTRDQVRLAAGRRPASDVPPVAFIECATLPAVLLALETSRIDACVLDGEAVPIGGMGVCWQIKNEVFRLSLIHI